MGARRQKGGGTSPSFLQAMEPEPRVPSSPPSTLAVKACPTLILLPLPILNTQMTPRFLAPALLLPCCPRILGALDVLQASQTQYTQNSPTAPPYPRLCPSQYTPPPSLTQGLKTNQKNHPCFLPSPQILQICLSRGHQDSGHQNLSFR